MFEDAVTSYLYKNQRPPAEVAWASSRGPSSYPQLCWWLLILNTQSAYIERGDYGQVVQTSGSGRRYS
jgi:hypothetical protein